MKAMNGWRVNGWRVNGWRVNGWRVNGWRVNGWRVNDGRRRRMNGYNEYAHDAAMGECDDKY